METLYEHLRARHLQETPALYYANKTITFAKLDLNVRKMISFFASLGLKQGDVVTIALPNIPSSIYAFYALNHLGIILNIVHPLTKLPQIVETMNTTKSKFAVILSTQYEKEVVEANPNLRFCFANPLYDNNLIMRVLAHKKLKKHMNVLKLDKYVKCKISSLDRQLDNPIDAVYLHSGGTTGNPKIISLSNDAINNLADKVPGIVNGDLHNESMLAVLPMFHGFGLVMGIHAPLVNKGAVAIMIKFNASKVIKWINKRKVTYIIGIPLLYQKLMNHKNFALANLKNLKYCFVGGDNVPSNMIETFNRLMKEHHSDCQMFEGYGLTETVTVCNVNTKLNYKIGSVGKPLDGMEIQIRNENGELILTPKMIGEVYIAGNTIMNGYLNDLNATNDTLVSIDGKLLVKTGDLGYLDEDGFLFLKGRIKRMYKLSGINIYPYELEKRLSELSDILDVSLEFFNKEKPYLILFVIKHLDSKKTNEEIEKQIMQIIESEYLKYYLPKKIIFVDSFPKTKVGKIDHEALKNLVQK